MTWHIFGFMEGVIKTQGGTMQKLMMALFLLSLGTAWATELPISNPSESLDTGETVKYWILDTDF